MKVRVGNRTITLDPTQSIGKGGEADIFKIAPDVVAKIFKTASHPDLQGQPEAQSEATARIAEHQKKLRAFPTNLPKGVIAPIDLIDDRKDHLIGYTMRLVDQAEVLLRYGERAYRQKAQITQGAMTEILRSLHRLVAGIHGANVVIGDFNDLNVLVRDEDVFLIDADSMQFGPYLCRMFTGKFVDPLLCQRDALLLDQPHTAQSDWYAYAVMVMTMLLYCGPHGGVYKPKQKGKLIPHGRRPLHRLTVFHPEVQYPKPAIPYGVLSDELLQHLEDIFVRDHRGEFPLDLIDSLEWRDCDDCGMTHCRNICPACGHQPLGQVVEVTKVHGRLVVTRIFHTDGEILTAAVQDERLAYLYRESGTLRREDGRIVTAMPDPPGTDMRFRLCRDAVCIAQQGRLITLHNNAPMETRAVDQFNDIPAFDADARRRYWIEQGELYRDGRFGPQYPERIGSVLPGQTIFWVGGERGFGFYRAGLLTVYFLFDPDQQGLNSSVKLPPISGQVVDATCLFGSDLLYFLLQYREGGRTVNRCFALNQTGQLLADAEADDGDGSWLGSLRAKCVVGNSLLSATDDAILSVGISNGKMQVTKEYPDTEPFVSSECHLYPGRDCLYVVTRQDILSLKIQ